jgi:mannose-6-phosphate isomerase-like protein (cupin superfamily)
MPPEATQIDLIALAATDQTGPLWGHETEDLDCTFLTWNGGHQIPPHVNDEVDVVMIVLAGQGEATVAGTIYPLSQGQTLVIPKSLERSITALSERFSYLNVHKRRRRLFPQPGGRPKPTAL